MDYNNAEVKQIIINILKMKSTHGDTNDTTATEIIKAFNAALANEQTKIFEKITDVILGVEARCMAADTVTPTLDEIDGRRIAEDMAAGAEGGVGYNER